MLLFGLAACISLWMACDDGVPEPISPEYPYAYYPLDTGKFWIYQVDSIIYNETFANDTASWQVMEKITDTFYDLEDRLNYIIERSRRPDSNAAWEIINVWQIGNIDGRVEKVENNLRFIKLVTPLLKGQSWDGNAYLGGLDDLPFDYECNRLSYYEGWNYSYASVDAPFTMNGITFPETVTVIQEGDSNLIWFDYAKEIYARDIGLIKKEFYHYYTQDITCPECPWNERVQCGYSVVMTVLDHN